MEVTVLQFVAFGFSAFAVGFSLCNVIWVFFSPQSKRNRRKDKTADADDEGQDRHDL